ncbi:MAG: ferrochelatase [Paracoccaceae bacterium]|nr:ferrochelatase [Paracoccaceae bacterium]
MKSEDLVFAGQGRLTYASDNHPPIPRSKIGIIIGNLGTPDATDYWSMRRYLSEFLSDRRVIDYSPVIWQPLLQLVILSKRPFSSGAAYRGIWNKDDNESPLLTIVRNQKLKLEAYFKDVYGDAIVLDFCMRYGNPSTLEVMEKLQAAGCEKILFFPLYPQYAAPTTATANDQVFRSLMKMNWQPTIRTVPAYYENDLYIESLASSVKEAYNKVKKKPEHLIVSYHGVPERYLLDGDPYHCQCQKTTRLLITNLGWKNKDVTTTFQSKFGPEKWIGPATVDYVAALAKRGIKNIAIVAPAFSADCVETLEEINEEIRASFLESGGETFIYVPCLNDRKDHIFALGKIIENELMGWV